MKIRICNKAVKDKKDFYQNIRVVECSEIGIDKLNYYQKGNDEWSLQYVVLYIDTEARKAHVKEMWVKDVVEK